MNSEAEVFIPLKNGKVATIDFSDWDKIRPYKWKLHKARGQVEYAVGRKTVSKRKRVSVLLHRLVWGTVPAGLELGHKDGKGLYCRKHNLHCITHQQNAQEVRARCQRYASQYRGVSWETASKKWVAQIRISGKLKKLGRFVSEVEAAKNYDSAAVKFFGSHAAPNFP